MNLQDAWNKLPNYRKAPPAAGYPSNLQHLFAPVDQVHQAIVLLINTASVSIAAAMYGWDDDEIDSLFRTKLSDEHIPVTLALDKSQSGGVHEKAILARWLPDVIGNNIVIGHSSKGAISHDKMVIVDGQVTIAGSTNFSTSGETKQNNECLIVWDAVFAAEARARIDIIHNEMLMQMQAAKES